MAVADCGLPMGLPTVDGLTRFDIDRYSVVKILRHIGGDADVDVTLEQEVSDHIAKRLKKTSGNFYVPTRLRSGLDTKTNAAGAFTVETEVGDLIELLRAKARIAQLGATFLTGLSSNVAFPVQLTATAGSWVNENSGSDVADSDSSFGQKALSPKTYEVSTSFSKKLLAQATIDVEAYVRRDIAKTHALAIDAAAINGSGELNQPLGILGTLGIGNVAVGVNGGAPSFGNITDLETAISAADADNEGMNFLTTPTMRGKLRKTEQFPGTNGVPVWQQVAGSGVGDVLGYPAYASRQVPSTLTKGTNSDCTAIIFGYWPALIIGEWGVLEILVDPYRLKKQGMVEVTSYLLADILLTQPTSFAAIKDARNV